MTYAELLQHQKDTGMSESDIYQELLAKGYKSLANVFLRSKKLKELINVS